jgi:signal transduction histidine kinase/ActR/RegA family two-component response regulator
MKLAELFDGIARMFHKLDPRIRSHLPELSGLVLVGMFGMLAWVIWEHQRTVERVQHTVEVETKILSVFATVQEADASARGFLVTGDDSYLKNYSGAVTTIEADVAQLRQLTADNAEQQRTLVALQPAIEERFAKLKAAIDLRRTADFNAVQSNFRAGSGPDAIRPVRELVATMTATENKLHASRVASVQRLAIASGIASLLALIVTLGSMAGWIWNTRREAHDLVLSIADREKNEAQIRQMQKIEAVGQLTGGLAHDLNNMLAVIISGLTLTQKRLAAGDANVQRFVSAAMDGATRAATLTNRLMAFSRQLPLAPERIDANRLVGGMSELMQRTLGEAIRIETVLNAGLWPTNADAGQLENALLNLSINARDAMPEGGRLTIETSNSHLEDAYARQHDMPSGDYILITVTDTGTGMTAAVIEKAFDPFFTTKGVGQGTGLGLSQAFGFIKQSGGHIRIYSEVGHGTTIKMYLPRLYDAGPEQAIRTAKEEAWPELPPEKRKENSGHLILVVEDDARVSEMTVSCLRELGYTVIHANGATAALTKLDAHPATALLFTDIVMPDVNGRQLAAEALRRRPDMKVLYTTGFTRNAIVHGGKLDAGLHFIAKPFTLVQIAAKMNEVLAGSRAS